MLSFAAVKKIVKIVRYYPFIAVAESSGFRLRRVRVHTDGEFFIQTVRADFVHTNLFQYFPGVVHHFILLGANAFEVRRDFLFLCNEVRIMRCFGNRAGIALCFRTYTTDHIFVLNALTHEFTVRVYAFVLCTGYFVFCCRGSLSRSCLRVDEIAMAVVHPPSVDLIMCAWC